MYKCINNSLILFVNGYIYIDFLILLYLIGYLKFVVECNIFFVDLRFFGVFCVCGVFFDSNNVLICLINVSNFMV